MNILIFAPHPDDDIIGCGGSIANHVKKGHIVNVVYLTFGDAGDLKYTKQQMSDIRKREINDAKSVLGIHETIYLELADGYIEYETRTVNKLMEIIREKKPDIVYLPHQNETHRDHSKTFELVKEAIDRAGRNSYQEVKGQPWNVSTVLSYEVWTPLTTFNYVEDISEVIETKLEALRKHSSQLANIAYDEAIKGLNRYRGAMSGKGTYCEFFEIIKTGKTN